MTAIPTDITQDVALAANELWHELASCAPNRDAEEQAIAKALMADRRALRGIIFGVIDRRLDDLHRIWLDPEKPKAVRKRADQEVDALLNLLTAIREAQREAANPILTPAGA